MMSWTTTPRVIGKAEKLVERTSQDEREVARVLRCSIVRLVTHGRRSLNAGIGRAEKLPLITIPAQ